MAKDSNNWPECVHSSLACIVDGLGGCCGQRQEEKIEFGTTVSVSLSLSHLSTLLGLMAVMLLLMIINM